MKEISRTFIKVIFSMNFLISSTVLPTLAWTNAGEIVLTDDGVITKAYTDTRATNFYVTEKFPSLNNKVLNDIQMPYIEYNKDLSTDVVASRISLSVDEVEIGMLSYVIGNRLYIIPADIAEYRGNHTCSLIIDADAVKSVDGEPNSSLSLNWMTSAYNEQYSSYPISVFANGTASAYLDNTGKLYTWGGWPTERGWEYYVTHTFQNVKSSCVGGKIFAYIDMDNNLWVAGKDSWFFPFEESPILFETNVMDVAYASEATLFYVKENSDLYGVGSDRFDQLLGKGNKEIYGVRYADTPIKLMEDVKSVISRDRNCAVIKNDGSLWMWGEYNSSKHYKLSSPRKIADDVIQASIGGGEPVTFVKSDNTGWYVDNTTLEVKKIGDYITYVDGSVKNGVYITKTGSLYGWGSNWFGQLGNGTTSRVSTPIEEAVLIMNDVAQVSLNYNYTLAITNDGDVYGWGANYCKRFKRNEEIDYNQTTPLHLYSASDNPGIKDLIVPEEFTVGLNGTYYIPIQTQPLNCVFSQIGWYTDEENIVSVSKDGLIKANALGDCDLVILIETFEHAWIEKTVRIHVVPEHDMGVEEFPIGNCDQRIDIYSIEGKRLHHNISDKDMQLLPSGLYIKRQGNYSLKLIVP